LTTVSLFKWSKPTNKSFFEKGHETLRRQKSHSEGAEGKKPVQGNQGHRDSPAHLRPLQGHHRAPAQEPVVRQLQGHGRQVRTWPPGPWPPSRPRKRSRSFPTSTRMCGTGKSFSITCF